MKKDIKPIIFFTSAVSLILFYLLNRAAVVFQELDGNILERFNHTVDSLFMAIEKKPFYLGFNREAMIAGAVGVAVVWLIFLYNVVGSKNYMKGAEHGTAKCGA